MLENKLLTLIASLTALTCTGGCSSYTLSRKPDIHPSVQSTVGLQDTTQWIGEPAVHRITSNVYAITDLFHTAGPRSGVNAGIIFTERSVVFIDCGANISSGEYLWNLAAERISDSTDIYLILTHHHSDHVFGMRVFVDHGTKVIAHVGVRNELKDDNGYYKSFIAEMSGWSASQADEILGDVIITVPDQVVDEDCVLNIDGEELRLLCTPGHVPDEIVVYHPASKTLFAGDAVYESRDPNTAFGGPEEWKTWIAKLERLIKLDLEVVVPGHGKLCDSEVIEKNIAYLKGIIGEQDADRSATCGENGTGDYAIPYVPLSRAPWGDRSRNRGGLPYHRWRPRDRRRPFRFSIEEQLLQGSVACMQRGSRQGRR